jgi:hypothetical protein
MIISSTDLFSYTPIRLTPLLLINCAFMRGGGGSFIATQKSQPILRHATNIHWQLNIETLGIKLLYGFFTLQSNKFSHFHYHDAIIHFIINENHIIYRSPTDLLVGSRKCHRF